jgi:hypothetical protein
VFSIRRERPQARSGKIQKNKKERMEERKIRGFFFQFFNIPGGSHTCVFSISQERPQARSGKVKKTRRKEWKKEK